MAEELKKIKFPIVQITIFFQGDCSVLLRPFSEMSSFNIDFLLFFSQNVLF